MMYSEFIEISGKSEKYITYPEYTTYIEPIYMQSEMNKQDFVKLLEDTYKTLVYPVVEKAIRNLSMTDKLNMMNGSESVMKPIEQIDFKARKIAYCYLNLLLMA